MQVRDRKGRRRVPLLLATLVAVAAAVGCQDRAPTGPGDGTPQFAKPPAAPVGLTLLIEAGNQAGDEYLGPLYAFVYDEGFGLEKVAAFDCSVPQDINGVDYCSGPGAIPVQKGTKAVVVVPGHVPSALFDAGQFGDLKSKLLPLTNATYETSDFNCEEDDCSIGTSVTDVQKGKVTLLPLVPENFAGGFDIKVNSDVTVDLGAPVASVVRGLEYEDFGAGSGVSNVDFPDYRPTTSTVMPLCETSDLPGSWTFTGTEWGVWPAVPMAFFGAAGENSTEVRLPYPDVADFPQARSCPGYPFQLLPLWVTELNFISQAVPGGDTQHTILETFEILSAADLANDPITRYARPLLCDASADVSKALEPYEKFGDASGGVDFLPPFVAGYQATIGSELRLTPESSSVAGWYTQYVTGSANVTFTLKNTSGEGSGTFSFSVTYSCESAATSPTGEARCTETSRQDNSAGSGFSADFNFRSAPDYGDPAFLFSSDLVETTWSIIGLPYPDGTVRYDVKTSGDKFPLAPGEGLESSDWPLTLPDTCKDTNDGRWALG